METHRRFGEFLSVHERLEQDTSDCVTELPTFPTSRVLRKNSAAVRTSRTQDLHVWLQSALALSMHRPAIRLALDEFCVHEIRCAMEAVERAVVASIKGSSLTLLINTGGWCDMTVGIAALYTSLGTAHQRLAFAKASHARLGDVQYDMRWDVDIMEEVAILVRSSASCHGRWFSYNGQAFDTRGLLYHLGTMGSVAPWCNPCGVRHDRAPRSGLFATNAVHGVTHHGGAGCAASWSSVSREPPGLGSALAIPRCAVDTFLSRPPTYPRIARTEYERNAWMALDLGSGRRLAVDHYSLRNDAHGYAASIGTGCFVL